MLLSESFWWNIYLGVEDDGTVCGVPENAAGDMVKEFYKDYQ